MAIVASLAGCSLSLRASPFEVSPPIFEGSRIDGTLEVFHVGEDIEVGHVDDTDDVVLRVHSVRDPYVGATTSPLGKQLPDPDWKFIGLDIELSNRGKAAVLFSALLGLSLVGDTLEPNGGKREFPTDWRVEEDEPPDSWIAAGTSKRGWAIFHVPDDGSLYMLRFKPAPFAAGVIQVELRT